MKYLLAKNTKRGFTLIELLVVIAIIGILASVVLASLSDSRRAARDAARISEVKQLQTALELYRNKTGGYPCYTTPDCASAGNVNNAALAATLARTPTSAYTAEETAMLTALNFFPSRGSVLNDGIVYILRDRSGGSYRGYRDSYTIRVRFESKVFPLPANANNPYCSIHVGIGHSAWNANNATQSYPPCF